MVGKTLWHRFYLIFMNQKEIYIIILYLFNLWQIECLTLLDQSKSYAVYDIWNITEAGKLELKFKTQSQYCLLLYTDDQSFKLENKRPSSKVKNYLEVALIKGKIRVTQQILSKKPKYEIYIGFNLNDLKWHTLRITKYIETLEVQVDKATKVISFPKNLASKFEIKSRLFLGGLSPDKTVPDSNPQIGIMPRFVGCIKDLKYGSGSLAAVPVKKVYKVESVAFECADKCSTNKCLNKGRCVNLFVKSGCDCFGTGYQGETCKQPSETINVKERDYLIWKIPEIDTLKWSTTLKFRLKAFKGDGLLFYTKRDENILIVELIGGKLRVAGGKITSAPSEKIINKNIFDAKWHSVILRRNHDEILVQIDNSFSDNFTFVENTRMLDSLADGNEDSIYFGGVKTPQFTFGVTSKRNYVGCLQQIEYNKNDVIHKVKNTITKLINVIGSLSYTCPYNESNIVLPTTTTVIAPTSTKSNTRKQIGFGNGGNLPIREVHTRDSTVGAGVIVWITTAIVIGTILILVSAGCVVHHIRLKYLHKTRQARERMLLEQNKDDQKDQETVPLASDKDRKKQSSESIDTSMMKEEIKKNDEPIEQPLLARKATETGV